MTVQETMNRSVFEDPVLQNELSLSRFILKDRNYTKQFSHIYFQRLQAIKPRLSKMAEQSWSKPSDLDSKAPRFSDKVLDVKGGQLSYLVGTIYANMDAKPSIIDDVKKDLWVVKPPETTSYNRSEPLFSIEDDSGRMKIFGEVLSRFNLVTGAVVALLGREASSGDFEVQDILLPGQLEQTHIIAETEPRYLAFVSGLNIGDNSQDISPELMLLEEFLLGGINFGSIKPSSIMKLVIAGNIYGPLDSSKPNTQDPTSKINGFLSQVCQSIPVYLLPGSNDPTTRALPQQPLHPGLFGTTSSLSTLHLAPNPFDSELVGLRVMGTAGQPLDDLRKCGSNEVTSLDWLEATLKFGHFAPTSPDTLYCYPYVDSDPFVLTSCPHIFFAGNQDNFATRIIKGEQGQKTCLITIPSFSRTRQIVLVEVSTLEATLVSFSQSLGEQ